MIGYLGISRFGFAYTLVRAYWRTGDEHFAHFFWRLFDDWRAHPPQQGVNWKCGQEITFSLEPGGVQTCDEFLKSLGSPATRNPGPHSRKKLWARRSGGLQTAVRAKGS